MAVLMALKKYGAIVADNGGFFSVSITPDDRYPTDCFSHILNSIDISNFEVIQTTGATEGPRSPGAPVANAGADQWITTGTTANLTGSVTAPGATTILWKLHSGPASVVLGNASAATTTATFSVPGIYTLMLSADDGVHAVTYDAAVITVTLTPTITTVGNDVHLAFPTVTGHHYRVQMSGDLAAWSTLADNLNGTGGLLDVTDSGVLVRSAKRQFYRVVVLD
jgi:hypothetical protein